MKFKIFISYSTNDLQIVEKFKSMLSHPAIELFIAEYSIVPGESLPQKIFPAIENCNKFILLWSKYSEMSSWVEKEIELARAFKKRTIPVLLDKEAVLPKPLDELRYLPYQSDPEYALSWIEQNIFELLKSKNSDSWFWLEVGAAFIWLLTRE